MTGSRLLAIASALGALLGATTGILTAPAQLDPPQAHPATSTRPGREHAWTPRATAPPPRNTWPTATSRNPAGTATPTPTTTTSSTPATPPTAATPTTTGAASTDSTTTTSPPTTSEISSSTGTSVTLTIPELPTTTQGGA